MPLLLFIGIGAMIDFGPLLSNPKMLLFGAAAQFGIFLTVFLASFIFPFKEAAAIGVIGAADGPTSIPCGEDFPIGKHGRDRCGGVFLYGAGADHPAAAIRMVTTRRNG